MINYLDLSGRWNFSLDNEKEGISKKYFSSSLNDTITLPGTTSMAKKGSFSDVKEIGFLTDPYLYEGFAWYQKSVTLAESFDDKQFILLLERTRMTKVWIDDIYVGEYNSLTTPHRYDITPYINSKSFTVTILVSNVDYPTKGGHLTSPDTQTNWNGIIGKIGIEVYPLYYISAIKTFPDADKHSLSLRITTVNNSDSDVTEAANVSMAPISSDNTVGDYIDDASISINIPRGTHTAEYTYNCPTAVLWSEYTPTPYSLKVIIKDNGDTYTTITGLRSFTTTETEFLINGTPTFLRGKHDGLIFPLTGAVPATVDEWLRVMSISKSYGINHYRFHTCCPPEAAFTAADLLGIYMEPQLPFWGTLTAPGDEGHNATEQDYLIEEGFRMMEEFGNHPSFCMMSLGNELWGSKERMAEIIRNYRATDDRHLYTQGSNNFQHTPVLLPEDDFFVGVRFAKNRLIRGSYGMCDAPLGHIQWDEPATNHNYNEAICPSMPADTSNSDTDEIEIQYGTGVKKVKAAQGEGVLIPHIPVVTHEIGQFAIYPNFKELDKYTGVLKARNFEVFRERLEEKGMLDQADDFFYTSGKLSVACYKEELEAAARSSLVAGYQILDIQDFSGQGTALVGILDAFMDSKGLVTTDEWSGFCSDQLVLAEFPKFMYEAGEDFKAMLVMRYYNPQNLIDASIHYELAPVTSYAPVVTSAAVISGNASIPDGSFGYTEISDISFALPVSDKPVAYELRLSVPGTKMHNTYEIYVYPTIDAISLPADSYIEHNDKKLYITTAYASAKLHLEAGDNVLFLPNEIKEKIEGFYCTDFWCYPMFRGICEWMKKPVAVGTMGLLIDTEHPALTDMLSHKYSTPQWYQIVTHADCAILDDATPKSYRPIIQMVDNFERNHKLGILFEANVQNGKLLVCTSRLSEISERPEVKQFAKGLLDYALSDNFNPKDSLDIEQLDKLF